jgi:CheY-like chemotaxis protein
MSASKQVLVVADEAHQLQTICRGLVYLGIGCVPAGSADEALAQLAAPTGARIDLLLVDLSSPGPGGAQLVERARALLPALPILGVTGLVLSSEVKALCVHGIPILRKPFTPDELGRAIETLRSARGRNGEPA